MIAAWGRRPRVQAAVTAVKVAPARPSAHRWHEAVLLACRHHDARMEIKPVLARVQFVSAPVKVHGPQPPHAIEHRGSRRHVALETQIRGAYASDLPATAVSHAPATTDELCARMCPRS
jgi:hypothetical protein